jgi:FAD:protein FMN transferase
MHHLIDPATGLPADGPWRTVSVAAANCADANIATTAAFVRGVPAAPWLAEQGLPARLVDWPGEVLTLAGWPAQAGQPGATAVPHVAAAGQESAGRRGRTLAA